MGDSTSLFSGDRGNITELVAMLWLGRVPLYIQHKACLPMPQARTGAGTHGCSNQCSVACSTLELGNTHLSRPRALGLESAPT